MKKFLQIVGGIAMVGLLAVTGCYAFNEGFRNDVNTNVFKIEQVVEDDTTTDEQDPDCVVPEESTDEGTTEGEDNTQTPEEDN